MTVHWEIPENSTFVLSIVRSTGWFERCHVTHLTSVAWRVIVNPRSPWAPVNPHFSEQFRFSHARDVICPNMSLIDRLGLFAELATDHYQRFLIMAQAHDLPFAISNILRPNFPHPSRLSQTPASRVLYVKPLKTESWQQVTQSSCHQENRHNEAHCYFERGCRHACTLCKHNVYVISSHETRKQPENSLPEELQTG